MGVAAKPLDDCVVIYHEFDSPLEFKPVIVLGMRFELIFDLLREGDCACCHLLVFSMAEGQNNEHLFER